MKNDENITLSLSVEEITERIAVLFKPEHKKLMPKCIVGVLKDNPKALSLVFKAAMGITPQLQYFVGNLVKVRYYNLKETYYIDKDKSKEEGYIDDQEMIVCTILECHPYSIANAYTVSYTGLNEKGSIITLKSPIEEEVIREEVSEKYP